MHPVTAKIHQAVSAEVPQLDGLIPTTRHNRLPIWAKADTPYKLIVPLQCSNRRAISLPQLDGFILTTRHDRLSIWAKTDAHYRESVPLQCSNQRTVSIPQLDGFILTP